MTTEEIKSLRPDWRLYVVFGILCSLYLGINQAIDNGRLATWKPLLWEASSVLVICAMIPFILRFENRVRIDSRPRWRAIGAHVLAALLFSAGHVAGIVIIRKSVYAYVGEQYDFGNLPLRWFYEFQKDLITYTIVLTVIFAYRQIQVRRRGELRAVELAAELSEARLRHLTAQIEPHFLFNALNAISNRMHEDVDAADRMISDLGDLLRAAYDSDSQTLVPLGREIKWLRGYAAMMSERFRGLLNFQLDVAPGLEALLVPRLLLQPLVENALKHGLIDGRGCLRVDVRLADRQLQYTVTDDGAGLTGEPVHGTGLSNVARRLELLFPQAHSFELRAGAERGTVASLTFPATP